MDNDKLVELFVRAANCRQWEWEEKVAAEFIEALDHYIAAALRSHAPK